MEIVAASTQCAQAALTLAEFQFPLPPELIAQLPAERRDAARLMVLDRSSGGLAHTHVEHLSDYLRSGDLLVVNDTRVIGARLFGRTASAAAVEILLVRPLDLEPGKAARWYCLGKPARRLRPGSRLRFPEDIGAIVEAAHGDGFYSVSFDAAEQVGRLLEQHGELPLPPYIRRPDGPLPLDQVRYQTIFASVPGAIAAPTAGLHFTDELVATLRARGVGIAHLTLHVGPGTFLPIRQDDVWRHVMQPEWCEIPVATVDAIRQAKRDGGRVVAVGTTTTRALESAVQPDGSVQPGSRWADCFIVPGHTFRVVDTLFTNFHLPGSTLLLLVSAFAGRQPILAAYAEAVRLAYRFYSYGDAMLIQ